jgi:branched-chain amino acid transport system permease protein
MVGAVWAYYEGFIYPQFAVDPLITIAIVLMTFLGGRATLWGPILGAFVLEMAQQYFAYALGGSQFYLIAYALVFLVVMVFMPSGIVPTVQEKLRMRRRRRRVDQAAGAGGASPASVSSPGFAPRVPAPAGNGDRA